MGGFVLFLPHSEMFNEWLLLHLPILLRKLFERLIEYFTLRHSLEDGS